MKTRITTAFAEMKLRQVFYLIRLDISKNYKSKPSQQLNPTQFIKSSAYHTLHLAHSNYRNLVIRATNIRTFEMNIRTVPSRALFLPTILVPIILSRRPQPKSKYPNSLTSIPSSVSLFFCRRSKRLRNIDGAIPSTHSPALLKAGPNRTFSRKSQGFSEHQLIPRLMMDQDLM